MQILIRDRPFRRSTNVTIYYPCFFAEEQGKVTAAALRKVCREAGVKFSEKEVKDMIEIADLNGDNAVDEEEFIQIMLKTNLF